MTRDSGLLFWATLYTLKHKTARRITHNMHLYAMRKWRHYTVWSGLCEHNTT